MSTYYERNKEKVRAKRKEYYYIHQKESIQKSTEYNRKHPDKSKIHANQSRKKRQESLKKELYCLLGNKCVQCGFSDARALQIDHINNDGYEERKLLGKLDSIGRNKYILSQPIKEIRKKYQLLCANCNWIKRFEHYEQKYK